MSATMYLQQRWVSPVSQSKSSVKFLFHSFTKLIPPGTTLQPGTTWNKNMVALLLSEAKLSHL